MRLQPLIPIYYLVLIHSNNKGELISYKQNAYYKQKINKLSSHIRVLISVNIFKF
jgi:hypothetical protein